MFKLKWSAQWGLKQSSADQYKLGSQLSWDTRSSQRSKAVQTRHFSKVRSLWGVRSPSLSWEAKYGQKTKMKWGHQTWIKWGRRTWQETGKTWSQVQCMECNWQRPICVGQSSGLLNANCFQTCLACLTTSQFNLAMQKQWCCWHTSHADHDWILLLQHAFSLCRVKTVSNNAPSLRYLAIRLHNFQCLLVHYSCHPINPNHISDILHRFASLCFEGLRWCRILDVAAGASLWDLVSRCRPGQTVEGHLVEFGKGSNGCMETWHVSLARQKKM